MAVPVSSHRNTNMLLWAGAVVVAVLLALFLIGGGHNNGQPSAQGGPGNAMQTDQGR